MTGPRQAKFGEPWSHHGAYAFDRKDVMTLDAPDEVVDGKEEGVVRARGTGAGRTFERQEEIMARVVALVNAAAGLTTEQAIARLALPEPAPADGWVRVEEGLPELTKEQRKPNAIGVEVMIDPPMPWDDYFPSRVAFFGCRQTDEPSFYLYGRVLDHVRRWRHLPEPPK